MACRHAAQGSAFLMPQFPHNIGQKAAYRVDAERERALERERQAKSERSAYIQRLAALHAERTGLPLTAARRHVEQVSVFLNPAGEDGLGRPLALTIVRYG